MLSGPRRSLCRGPTLLCVRDRRERAPGPNTESAWLSTHTALGPDTESAGPDTASAEARYKEPDTEDRRDTKAAGPRLREHREGRCPTQRAAGERRGPTKILNRAGPTQRPPRPDAENAGRFVGPRHSPAFCAGARRSLRRAQAQEARAHAGYFRLGSCLWGCSTSIPTSSS